MEIITIKISVLDWMETCRAKTNAQIFEIRIRIDKESKMADTKMKLFRISLYDKSDNFKKDEVYNRYSSAYCTASSLEKATEIARANAGKDQIVSGVNEEVDTKYFHE